MVFQYEQPPEKFAAWRGPTLPLIRKKGGYFKSEYIENLVWSSITVILATAPGEILGNREFGTIVKTSLFEQNTDALRTRLSASIMDALIKYEPRVKVMSIDVRPTDTTIGIYIVARLTNTNKVIRKGFKIERFKEFKIIDIS